MQPKNNQYGREKGCSSSHLLVPAWDQIVTGLKESRAAVTLTAIDYCKAFNRMRHHKCLEAFALKGASNATLELIAGFLAERQMTVKVGNTFSEP